MCRVTLQVFWSVGHSLSMVSMRSASLSRMGASGTSWDASLIWLHDPQHEQDDQQGEQHPNRTAGPIAPCTAVAPAWQHPNQGQDQDDNKGEHKGVRIH